MEGYPPEYIYHELPLVAYSGLSSFRSLSSGITSPTTLPGSRIALGRNTLSDELSRAIEHEFSEASGQSWPWNASGNPDCSGLLGFNFFDTARELIFPRRKAAPAAQAPSDDTTGGQASAGTSTGYELHSVLSPLSPTSPLYPDGLLTPSWLRKHQQEVPSVLLCFFPLGEETASNEGLDAIKQEINNIKTALSRSAFRTRLVVTVVTESATSDDDQSEDSAASIRRATGLDARTTFFFLSRPTSQEELSKFIVRLLTAIQPLCVDYYRDLTKHSRRKKNRGVPSGGTGGSSAGTSQALVASGWNARYDFKQGVFAEFRQEMDAAERHFTSAIDELFAIEGILELTPIWSARWAEARQMTDIIALRAVRCQLWRGVTTGAVQTWSDYRDRTRSLVERRAHGISTDAHATWESRWSEIMAQLIERADVPAFRTTKDVSQAGDDFVVINILLPPERSQSANELTNPLHFLHHPGYWLNMACRWAAKRYQGKTPDTKSLQNTYTPELTEVGASTSGDTGRLTESSQDDDNDFRRMLRLMEQAEGEFRKRNQFRRYCQLLQERAQLLADEGNSEKALNLLHSTWQQSIWRREGWWNLMGDIMLSIHQIAQTLDEIRLLTELRWEMQCNVFASIFTELPTNATQHSPESTGVMRLSSESRLSPVSLAFAFHDHEAHVGDSVICQIFMESALTESCSPLDLQEAVLIFNDGDMEIIIAHQAADEGQPSHQDLVFSNTKKPSSDKSTLRSTADLTIHPATHTTITFDLPVRDPGELLLTTARIVASFEGHSIQYDFTDPAQLAALRWHLPGIGQGTTRSLDRDDTTVLYVHPKPPMVELSLAGDESQYFTSRQTQLSIKILNGETETIAGSIHVTAPAESIDDLDIAWISEGEEIDIARSQTVKALATANTSRHTLRFTAPAKQSRLALTVRCDYSTTNEPDVTMTKTTTFNINFTHPFTIDYEFHPKLDPAPWPSYFDMPDAADPSAKAIRQQWQLTTVLTSQASVGLEVTESCLTLEESPEAVICNISEPDTRQLSLEPGSTLPLPFMISLFRPDTDDRRPAHLDLEATIKWRLPGSAEITTSTVSVPPLTLPAAEPRVLCTLTHPDTSPASTTPAAPAAAPFETLQKQPARARMTLTIENPTSHYLTFHVSMPLPPSAAPTTTTSPVPGLVADHHNAAGVSVSPGRGSSGSAPHPYILSGPKARHVALCPFERVSLDYFLALLQHAPPHPEDGPDLQDDAIADASSSAAGRKDGRRRLAGVDGEWIALAPRVVDRYFNKELRVIPGDGGREGNVRVSGRGGDGGTPLQRPGSSGNGLGTRATGIEVWIPY